MHAAEQLPKSLRQGAGQHRLRVPAQKVRRGARRLPSQEARHPAAFLPPAAALERAGCAGATGSQKNPNPKAHRHP